MNILNKKDIECYVQNGFDLEILVASYFQMQGYYVENNLKRIDVKKDGTGNVDVFELDVFAKKVVKSKLTTSLIECKRGCDFNDLFKFSGISNIVGADTNILLCQSHQFLELKKIGTELGIVVISLDEIIDFFDTEEKLINMSYFVNSNLLSNNLFSRPVIQRKLNGGNQFLKIQKEAYGNIRSVMSELIGKIWRQNNLTIKANQIRSLMDSNKDFVRTIARKLDLIEGNKKSEYYMQKNIMCESAAYLVLQMKISYLICAVELAINLSSYSEEDINKIEDSAFINLVENLKKDLNIAKKIPNFIQVYIHIFGGVHSDDNDLIGISNFLGYTLEDTEKILDLLMTLFKLSDVDIQWGFVEDMGITSFRYIPTSFKGIGMVNRKFLNMETKEFLFYKQWGNNYNEIKVLGGK